MCVYCHFFQRTQNHFTNVLHLFLILKNAFTHDSADTFFFRLTKLSENDVKIITKDEWSYFNKLLEIIYLKSKPCEWYCENDGL